MIKRQTTLMALAALLSLGLGACDANREGFITPDGGDGTLRVVFDQPVEGVGAVLLDVTGGQVLDPRGAEGVELHTTEIAGGVRVAVVGEELTGTLFTFRVEDRALAGDYQVRVLQVADVRNLPIEELGGYKVAVR